MLATYAQTDIDARRAPHARETAVYEFRTVPPYPIM